jgi:deoxyribodipyrimidine photo-lyase
VAVAAARDLPVRLEAIDGNGLLPLRAAGQAWITAYQFRSFLQKTLPAHLSAAPAVDPLAVPLPARLRELPQTFVERWPKAPADLLEGGSLADLPIDHTVAPVAATPGGEAAAQDRLTRLLAEGH